ncbi:MAG: cupin domain-containing protein [Rhodobacteraceae bacterium]|nr:cupin domain-containing protein [Paracoccaceae bacterium]
MKAVNLAGKLALVDTHRDPRVVASYNGNDIMVVKFEGEVMLDVGEETHVLGPGELFVVPKGMRHRPRAAREAKVLLIEPAGTPNTGDPATAAKKAHI